MFEAFIYKLYSCKYGAYVSFSLIYWNQTHDVPVQSNFGLKIKYQFLAIVFFNNKCQKSNAGLIYCFIFYANQISTSGTSYKNKTLKALSLLSLIKNLFRS